jgi:DNA-binding response OmpR family regulator
VILDIVMPKMDGLACFHELKKVNPDVAVLAVSGYSDKAKEKRILEAGARAFLRKPFHVSELAQKMNNVLVSGDSGK